tara:strand:- start:334 stop:1005 length:672 start_codon:yes stop_codon:yes gene_type:complete
MKVKIKKKGKTKSFKVIDSWSDVNLETWSKLIQFTELSKSKEAEETIAALSDIPKKLIKELSIQDVGVILSKIAELQAEQDSSLNKIIEIEGKKYGFHPDFDSMTLGEYADLEQMITTGINDRLPDIMAILYRPVTEEGENGVYTIEAYDGNIKIRAEQMKKMSAVQVQNALVFFYNFVKVLLTTLESFSMQRLQEMKMQLPQSLLQKNGVGSESSIDSQEGK